MNDFEKRLRASLRRHAGSAPDGDALAEQIIARAGRAPATSPGRRPSQWRTWSLPLVAAAAVLAVALVIVGVNQFGQDSHHVAAGPSSPAPSATHHPSTPTATGSQQVTTPQPTPTRTVSVLGDNSTQLLSNVKVLDLSFVGADDGWALATADCLGAPTHATCTAMLRTTDGGTSWQGIPTPPANVPTVRACAAPCVQHVRFATDEIGYAFGPSALFMTTDGGRSWVRSSGGADALETLDGNVIRVVHEGEGCPPGCTYKVQTAPIGGPTWTPVPLPRGTMGESVGVTLTRTGSSAYLAVFGHTAGGAQRATSTLYTSTDDGASWQDRGEPCPQLGGTEVDSTQLTSAADGSVSVLCTPRSGQSWQFTATSTDGGATFRHGAVHGLGAAPVSVMGAASATVLFVSSDQTYRSANAGRTWQRLGADGAGGPGELSWFGFESLTDARAVSKDGTSIWTTHDAGVTWVPYSFR